MALADEIRKRLNTQPGAAAPVVSQQAQAVAAFQAKTGKATGGGAPRASSIGENLAQAQVDAAQRQVAQQGAVAATGIQAQQEAQAAQLETGQQRLDAQAQDFAASLAAQRGESTAARAQRGAEFAARAGAREAMALQDMNARASSALAELATKRGIVESDIFEEFRQSNNELGYRRDAAELEQRAFLLAMKDRAYVDNLLRIGQERRLENELNFREDMQAAVLGNNLDEMLKQLNFNIDLSADQRAFNEMLSGMDINVALAIATQGNKDATTQQMLSNIGSVATGVSANYKNSEPEYKSNYENANVDTYQTTQGGGGKAGYE